MRRKMIRWILLIGIVCFICGICGLYQYTQKTELMTLHLMHTNDLHAHLIPFHPDNRVCDYEQPACRGGFARLKALIDSYRQKYSDLILLDAGDRFSGTVFYSLRKGQDIIRLMNEMSYDVMTLGNHDFDDGLNEIEKMMTSLQAPMVVANAVFPETTPLVNQIKKSVVIERNGRKIGVIGALTKDVKIETVYAKEIQLIPLAQVLQQEANRLKAQGVNIIILLSHIGFEMDQSLAQQLEGIDVIVGGHSHTLLSNQNTQDVRGRYPTVIQNPIGKPVLIVSTGMGGQYIGQLNVVFDSAGKIVSYEGDTIEVNSNSPIDPKMRQEIALIEQEMKAQLEELLTTAQNAIPFTPKQLFCSESCYVGEVLTSLLLQAVPDADIAFLNAGGIRAGLPQGGIHYQQLVQSYPFDSAGAIVSLTGEEIKNYIEHGLKNYTTDDRTNAFMQTAGISYTFNPKTKRVLSIMYQGQPLDSKRIYRVVMPAFVAQGGDGYPEQSNVQILSDSVRTLLKKAMQTPGYHLPSFENRIRVAF